MSYVTQHSLVFRYVLNGKTVEKCLGFYNVSSGQTAEDLFNLISQECNMYEFKNELVAQTNERTAVMTSDLNGLQGKIKSVAVFTLS